jgi:hypothetical protein
MDEDRGLGRAKDDGEPARQHADDHRRRSDVERHPHMVKND